MLRFLTATIVTVLFVSMLGCGGSNSGSSGAYFSEADAVVDSSVSASPGLGLSPGSQQATSPDNTLVSVDNSDSSPTNASRAVAESVRKIVYNANLNLTVKSFAGVAESIVGMSHQFGGFVAQANITQDSADRRRGSWTLRIPTEHYRAFLASAGDLGAVSSLKESTKEVTAEFYDIEARIRNKQKEEQRLNRILEERPGKLDDVLSVEREVSRVRQEIEVMQGRLRVLQDLTSYSTVSISVLEVPYQAPVPPPTFGSLILQQWHSTSTNMQAAFQQLVLWSIAVGPWLVVISLPVTLIILMKRQFRVKPPERGSVA